MTYVLHYAPDNASLIIRLALDHLALPYTHRLVDRAAYGQRDPAYLALNPNGLIPVLETPQGPLFETGAILLWLADSHGGIGPSPQDSARGDFLKWLFFVSNTLHPALRLMFYPAKYIGPDPTLQEALRLGLEGQIRTALGQLDKAAASGVFAQDAPNAIDFYLAGCLRWCALYPDTRPRDWFDLADTPRLAQLCRQLEDLPCTAALQRAEGLGPTPFSAPTYATPPQGSAT
ncbi:MAG: glutathione S-transferase family protein [Sulfitobacter sp.]